MKQYFKILQLYTESFEALTRKVLKFGDGGRRDVQDSIPDLQPFTRAKRLLRTDTFGYTRQSEHGAYGVKYSSMNISIPNLTPHYHPLHYMDKSRRENGISKLGIRYLNTNCPLNETK